MVASCSWVLGAQFTRCQCLGVHQHLSCPGGFGHLGQSGKWESVNYFSAATANRAIKLPGEGQQGAAQQREGAFMGASHRGLRVEPGRYGDIKATCWTGQAPCGPHRGGWGGWVMGAPASVVPVKVTVHGKAGTRFCSVPLDDW